MVLPTVRRDSSNATARDQRHVNQIIAGINKLAHRTARGRAEDSVGIN